MEDFTASLKKMGKQPGVVRTLALQVAQFEDYLTETTGVALPDALPEHLDQYAAQCEEAEPGNARKRMRGLILYYRFAGRDALAARAAEIREAGIAERRRSFSLAAFRGVPAETIRCLEKLGIRDIEDMLRAGRTCQRRKALAASAGVPVEEIEELVGLSDLARIPGIKAVRARLYYDAGVTGIEKLAAWAPAALRRMLEQFVQETGFEGIPPLPKETRSAVAKARRLPRVVEK